MDINSVIITSIQLFAVLNPLSIIPVFLSLAHDRTPEEKRNMVIGATLVVIIISVVIIFWVPLF